MASTTAANSQISDSVSQTNLMVIGVAPAQAIGSLLQVASASAGLSMQNAVMNQQLMNELAQAVIAASTRDLLDVQRSALPPHPESPPSPPKKGS